MATQASVNQVQSMYVAYYGRPGDPAGINWWADQLDNNQGDLSAIIDQFGNSDEYESRYGSLSDSQLINQFYQNTFGRDADEGGLNFYLGKLQAGEFTIASIAKNIWDGVTGDDAAITTNKLDVANYFTVEAGQDLRNYSSDIIDDVVSMLAGITGSDASGSSARSEADGILAAMEPEIIPQLAHGPTAYQQFMLELINRARLDPMAESERLDTDLNLGLAPGTIGIDPVQPLSLDSSLTNVAQDHSEYLIDNPFRLSHDQIGSFTTINGQFVDTGTVEYRIVDAGYLYDVFHQTIGYAGVSTIGGGGLTPERLPEATEANYEQLFAGDEGSNRESILEADFSDIGIGLFQGIYTITDAWMNTNIYASPLVDGGSTLLGVVYTDRDENDFYTPGEGIDDAIVRITSDSNDDHFAAYTMNEGGYQIDLQPGTYDIQFTYNGQDHFVNDVVVGSENVKVDWMM